jgi:histidinol-phosphate phosphatase family protein
MGSGAPMDYVIVIPTIGRPSLARCLDALETALGAPGAARPRQVVLADDRPDTPEPLPSPYPVVTLEGRGPAAARNAGWRAAEPAEWVVFLDDDVVVSPDWAVRLGSDLADVNDRVGGVQGVVTVPEPRRPSDSQRATLGLVGAPWITADMAYRRAALADAGGFDERFPRAYREDSDLAIRVRAAGWRLRRGSRVVSHPTAAPRPWASLRAQAGNADDAAMLRLHGRRWRAAAGAARGRRSRHVATCLLGALAFRNRWALGGWAALTAEFAARRVLASPREALPMLVTSAAIPPLAVGHWVAGWRRFRGAHPWPPRPAAILFDRDGTLITDVPYNGDPSRVTPVPDARAALRLVREAGLATGVVSNQAGIGHGMLTSDAVAAVNSRVSELLGPFGTWRICPHRPDAGCGCRKPSPGLILAAASDLGVRPSDCVVIGDTAADVAAARAAGARGVLVPAKATLDSDRVGVPCADSLLTAVAFALAGELPRSWS